MQDYWKAYFALRWRIRAGIYSKPEVEAFAKTFGETTEYHYLLGYMAESDNAREDATNAAILHLAG